MKHVSRVKVPLPKAEILITEPSTAIAAAVPRPLAVWDVYGHPEWVFGHVGHGKGSWDAVRGTWQGLPEAKRCLQAPLFVQKSSPLS